MRARAWLYDSHAGSPMVSSLLKHEMHAQLSNFENSEPEIKLKNIFLIKSLFLLLLICIVYEIIDEYTNTKITLTKKL